MNIKETVGTPSRALELMLEGLLDPNRPFKIEMGSWGVREDGECFGCAATCASYKLLGNSFIIEVTKRWQINRPVGNSIRQFEDAIDDARLGLMSNLFFFFGLDSMIDRQLWDRRIELGTENWQNQIPQIKQLIADLKAAGF